MARETYLIKLERNKYIHTYRLLIRTLCGTQHTAVGTLIVANTLPKIRLGKHLLGAGLSTELAPVRVSAEKREL